MMDNHCNNYCTPFSIFIKRIIDMCLVRLRALRVLCAAYHFSFLFRIEKKKKIQTPAKHYYLSVDTVFDSGWALKF